MTGRSEAALCRPDFGKLVLSMSRLAGTPVRRLKKRNPTLTLRDGSTDRPVLQAEGEVLGLCLSPAIALPCTALRVRAG